MMVDGRMGEVIMVMYTNLTTIHHDGWWLDVWSDLGDGQSDNAYR